MSSAVSISNKGIVDVRAGVSTGSESRMQLLSRKSEEEKQEQKVN
jgi:hypothetical protein